MNDKTRLMSTTELNQSCSSTKDQISNSSQILSESSLTLLFPNVSSTLPGGANIFNINPIHTLPTEKDDSNSDLDFDVEPLQSTPVLPQKIW